jgi:hypothetical protein
MSILLDNPPNVTFDVYRGFSPASPYLPPNTPAALRAQTGYLRQHVRNGRFGRVVGGVQVWWTTVLEVSLGTDIRSAYNSELDAFNEANGDTVMVHDYPVKGTCTAFVVVMVQRRLGTAGPYLRCYLDRARPSYTVPCPDPTQVLGAVVPCCPNVLPAILQAAIIPDQVGSCSCLATTVPLIFNPNTLHWTGTAPDSCVGTWSVDLFCQIPFVTLVFNCTLLYNGTNAMRLPETASCNPISYQALWVVQNACPAVPGASTGTLVITQ